MRRFLAIGECMVEMAPEPDGRYRMGFAGDTFNTAWYMRKLAPEAAEIAYMSAIGDDAISARMERFMRDAGIVPELAVRAGGTVGLYMISLQDGERSFSYWRSTSAARRLADGLKTLPGIASGDMAYVSGITVAVLPEPGRIKLFSALEKARKMGATIVFDPNLRPALWPSTEAMREWITRAATTADIVLPSFEDEAHHFGDTSPQATAARYKEAGARLCVVKNGDGPILVASDDNDMTIPPLLAPEVVDTTAAGDSFNAGFLSALAGGASPEDAVRMGCEIAVRVIGKRGALVDL